MAVFNAPVIGGAAVDYTIDQSLRFNDNDSAYLSRVPASAGNRKTWTWSGWVKRGNISYNYAPLFQSYVNDSNRFNAIITSGDIIEFQSKVAGSNIFVATTTPVFRDTAQWSHITVSADLQSATAAADRFIVYVNGERIALSLSTFTDHDTMINAANVHYIGKYVFTTYLDGIRKAGSSVGAVIEIVADGVPAGLGAPIYAKLDQDIASNLMSINAVKGVEIGNGFEAARITGEQNADEMRMGNDGAPVFLSNNAGGILAGLSTGQPVVARVAFKPTSSILTPRRSIDETGAEVDLRTKGRHDPCVGIRAAPVVEAMTACVLADAFLRHRAQTGGGAFAPGREGRS